MTDRAPQPPPYPAPYPPPPPGPYIPPQGQPGPWPPGPPTPPRRRKGRVILTVLAVVIIGFIGFALALAGGRADRTDPGRSTPSLPTAAAPSTAAAPVTLSAFDLQPGDCYNAAPLPTDGTTRVIGSVESVPCDQPHTAQVVAVPDYPGRSHEEAIATLSVDGCTQEFQDRLRSAVLKDKRYQLGRIYPDAIAWNRTTSVACVIATDTPTTGSVLKG